MNLSQAPWSRTQATIGLLGAIAFLASRTCQSSIASTTIRFDVGPEAGRTLRSHAVAAISYPSSCASTACRPSTPVSLLLGDTCCQAKRKRMKSLGLTGTISARRRFSV